MLLNWAETQDVQKKVWTLIAFLHRFYFNSKWKIQPYVSWRLVPCCQVTPNCRVQDGQTLHRSAFVLRHLATFFEVREREEEGEKTCTGVATLLLRQRCQVVQFST